MAPLAGQYLGHWVLPWALHGTLATTGCSGYHGMLLASGDAQDWGCSWPLGDAGCLGHCGKAVGAQMLPLVPRCCHPCPSSTAGLEPPPPQMSLSSLSPVTMPQPCPSHVPKVTRACDTGLCYPAPTPLGPAPSRDPPGLRVGTDPCKGAIKSPPAECPPGPLRMCGTCLRPGQGPNPSHRLCRAGVY